jgi:hypothetical protein
VYDEKFIFTLKDLLKEDFQQGIIRIVAWDAATLPIPGCGRKMIGEYAVDAIQVGTVWCVLSVSPTRI